MIDQEIEATIRRLYYAEHWKVGTIAAELGLHHETVERALRGQRSKERVPRPSLLDPFEGFIRETLKRHPRLRSTRIWAMLRERGYSGSQRQLRRRVAQLRPTFAEAFLRRRTFPGEEGQVDWASFGHVTIGLAKRALSAFVITLSYSRALFLRFFFDQTLESFCEGHVQAFADWGGVPRILLYDNLRAAVIQRHGEAVQFNPRLIELASHYHFAPRACRPARGNEKGGVERAIRYIRDSFFAARPFTTLEDFNRQALRWRDEIAMQRPWPGDSSRTVAEVFAEERCRLLSLPTHPFETDSVQTVSSKKLIYVRFDKNDYSIPPSSVGRSLTLVASQARVRIFDGPTQVASHRRSWDRNQRIEDQAHIDALLAQKRRALNSTPSGRLRDAVPEAEDFLEAAFHKGEAPGVLMRKLLLLLDDYGASELRAAVREALDRQTPRLSSVSFILGKRRRGSQRRPTLPVALSRRPDLEDLYVQPHSPENYDDLTDPTDESFD